MVRMAMGIENGHQLQTQLLDQGPIAAVLLEDRVYDHRLPGLRIAQEVGIRGRAGVEELPENKVAEQGFLRGEGLMERL